MARLHRFALLSGALCAAAAAAAQPASNPRGASALSADVAVPAARHVSPFARYRSSAEVAVGSWKDANDAVARIGGWRAYAREAAAPAPAAAASRPEPGHDDPRGR